MISVFKLSRALRRVPSAPASKSERTCDSRFDASADANPHPATTTFWSSCESELTIFESVSGVARTSPARSTRVASARIAASALTRTPGTVSCTNGRCSKARQSLSSSAASRDGSSLRNISFRLVTNASLARLYVSSASRALACEDPPSGFDMVREHASRASRHRDARRGARVLW